MVTGGDGAASGCATWCVNSSWTSIVCFMNSQPKSLRALCACVCVYVCAHIVCWAHLSTRTVSKHDNFKLPVLAVLLRVRHDASTVSEQNKTRNHQKERKKVVGWLDVVVRIITDGWNKRWAVGKQRTPFWLYSHNTAAQLSLIDPGSSEELQREGVLWVRVWAHSCGLLN